MDQSQEVPLEWPPKAEDLKRLYIDEHLSAAKIAARYGLKYASPKTAESTVLYHLKRNGISRRDKAEHARKVTEEMVDEWVKRYEAGESLKQIAGNEFSAVTVFLHLRKRGVQLRDKVEAQIKAVTKYARAPFRGDKFDAAYTLGFVWGDCSVEKHGRAVRVRSGTTHPEFANLFKSLFGSYGHIRLYPKLAKVTPAEWNLEVDLDGSFEFLMAKNIQSFPDILNDKVLMLCFLAGFADAEGSIYYHRKSNVSGFEFSLSNTNLELLKRLQQNLSSEGYHPKLYRSVKRVQTENQTLEFEIWHLTLYRFLEVKNILEKLQLRHNEKLTKAKIALANMRGELESDSEGLPIGWLGYLENIRAECDAFVQEALVAVTSKTSKTSE